MSDAEVSGLTPEEKDKLRRDLRRAKLKSDVWSFAEDYFNDPEGEPDFALKGRIDAEIDRLYAVEAERDRWAVEYDMEQT